MSSSKIWFHQDPLQGEKPTSFRQAIVAEREVAVVIEPHLAAVAAVDAQRTRVFLLRTIDLGCIPPGCSRRDGSLTLLAAL